MSRYRARMSNLSAVGDRDNWRCWLCDEPVDPDASVNSDLGPSVDLGLAKSKKAAPGTERLAHRACNTRKGAVKPVVPWSPELFVVDPAPIAETVERLGRKRGREVVARCPAAEDDGPQRGTAAAGGCVGGCGGGLAHRRSS